MKNDYEYYLWKLGLGSKAETIIRSIFPEKVYVEYEKMIELLQEYENLREGLEREKFANDGIMDDISSRKEDLMDKQELSNQSKEIIAGNEQIVNNTLRDVQTLSSQVTIDNLSSVEHLSLLVEKLRVEMIKLTEQKEALTELNNNKNVEKRYEKSLGEYHSSETYMTVTLENISEVISKIYNQMNVLDNFRSNDGKQRIENIDVRQEHLDNLGSVLGELSKFSALLPEYKKAAIQSYLQVFSSYIDLKKEHFSQLLSVAKNLISEYNNRPSVLPVVPSHILEMNLEQFLKDTKTNFSMIAYSDDKSGEFNKVVNSVEMIKSSNKLAIKLMRNEDLENTISEFKTLHNNFVEKLGVTSYAYENDYYGNLLLNTEKKFRKEQEANKIIEMMENNQTLDTNDLKSGFKI